MITSVALTGCTSPTVFVNQHGLSASDLERVTNAVEQQGLVWQVVDLEFPSGVDDSTIILSSKAWINDDVRQLQEITKSLGFATPSVKLIMEGNHWYRDGNIGLYLRTPTKKLLNQSNLLGTYQGDKCRHLESLNLMENGRFQFTQSNLKTPMEGRWSFENRPILHLFHRDPYIDFFYQANLTDTGELTLIPHTTNSVLESCSLELQ